MKADRICGAKCGAKNCHGEKTTTDQVLRVEIGKPPAPLVQSPFSVSTLGCCWSRSAPPFVSEPFSAVTRHYKFALAEKRFRMWGQPIGSAAREWRVLSWANSIRNWR